MKSIEDIQRAREERKKQLALDNAERIELYLKQRLKTRELDPKDLETTGTIRLYRDQEVITWSKSELAELIKVNPRTLYKWLGRGIFPEPVHVALGKKNCNVKYSHKTKVYLRGEANILHHLLLNFFNERSTLTPDNSEIINSINEQILEFRTNNDK